MIDSDDGVGSRFALGKTGLDCLLIMDGYLLVEDPARDVGRLISLK